MYLAVVSAASAAFPVVVEVSERKTCVSGDVIWICSECARKNWNLFMFEAFYVHIILIRRLCLARVYELMMII